MRALTILAALIAGVLSSAALAADAPKGPLPVAAFFHDPAVRGGRLSPDGKFLALIQPHDEGTTVTVTDLAANTTKVVFSAEVRRFVIRSVTWKGDRLIVAVGVLQLVRVSDHDDLTLPAGYGQSLMLIDKDGQHPTVLFQDPQNPRAARATAVYLIDPLRKDADHVLVAAPDGPGARWGVYRTDIHTGQSEKIDTAPSDTYAWNTDANGALVARYTERGSVVIVEGRSPADGRWTEVVRLKTKDLRELADFEILDAADGVGRVYVAVRPKDASEGDGRTLHIYDVATKTMGPALWPPMKADIVSVITDPDTNALQGVCYYDDVFTCDFKDKDKQANFRGLSRFFSGERGISPVSISDDHRWWLFGVSGPNEPGSYYLYDWQTKHLDNLGYRFPSMPQERLGPAERYTYTARDGTKISGYLTRPPGAPAGPLPMIVMPHGGPELRDTYDFDAWTQYLATRGYLVFQPNFRGSSGYGLAFAQAGYRHWGTTMADDVTDGVKALIDAHIVDPARICIAGASYGGYAALYAGATHPELYKCVVSAMGPSDLIAMMKFERRDAGGEATPQYQYWLRSIGDPAADAERLTHDSPITYAASYQPPVLLIHGMADPIVPPAQSQIMEAALKRAKKQVKLITYPDEGHGFSAEIDQKALEEIDKFVEAHIAPAR